MHEAWCEVPAHHEEGICLSLDIEHMHEWWCETKKEETTLCEVLAWKREAKAGGMVTAKGELRKPPPPMISVHESRQMMAEWCLEDSHNATAPCHGRQSKNIDQKS